MHPLFRVIAHGALLWLVATPVVAQTPAPPDWHDGAPSVYSAGAQKETKAQGGETVEQSQAVCHKIDTSVIPSAHQEPIRSEEPVGRRLAPPTVPIGSAGETAAVHGEGGSRRLMDFGIPTQSIYTIATALTIVIGSFLLFAWALRRGSRGRIRARGMLPAEAVSV